MERWQDEYRRGCNHKHLLKELYALSRYAAWKKAFVQNKEKATGNAIKIFSYNEVNSWLEKTVNSVDIVSLKGNDMNVKWK